MKAAKLNLFCGCSQSKGLNILTAFTVVAINALFLSKNATIFHINYDYSSDVR